VASGRGRPLIGLPAHDRALMRAQLIGETLDAVAHLLVGCCDGGAPAVGKDDLGPVAARSFHQHDVPHVERRA
jgi:hypothetical protein